MKRRPAIRSHHPQDRLPVRAMHQPRNATPGAGGGGSGLRPHRNPWAPSFGLGENKWARPRVRVRAGLGWRRPGPPAPGPNIPWPREEQRGQEVPNEPGSFIPTLTKFCRVAANFRIASGVAARITSASSSKHAFTYFSGQASSNFVSDPVVRSFNDVSPIRTPAPTMLR